MKQRIVTLFLIFFYTLRLFSQIEVKTSPLLWISRTGTLGIEYGIKPNLGIEAEYQHFQASSTGLLTTNANANGGLIALKHYFLNKKETPLANLYVGGYTFYMAGDTKINNRTSTLTMYSFGAIGGYKGLLFKNHLVLESGLYFGKRFVYKNGEIATANTDLDRFFYNWDVFLRLLVGYRF